MSRKNCCRKSESDCGCKPEKKKCKAKKTTRFIPQANMTLSDAIQVPDLNTFITGCVGCTGCAIECGCSGPTSLANGLLTVDLPQISPSGGAVFAIYENLYNVANVAQAEMFSNINGKLVSIGQVLPDAFALGEIDSPGCPGITGCPGATGFGNTVTGRASPDLSIFSVFDVNNFTGSCLRIRIFSNTDFVTPIQTIFYCDYDEESGSANSGNFTQDNAYIYFNYITTLGVPVFKIVSVSTGLTVASVTIPGFSSGAEYAILNGIEYFFISYGTLTNFAELFPAPPFGFQVYKFVRPSALTLVASSPLLPGSLNTFAVTVLSGGKVARIITPLSDATAGIPGAVYPVIPGLFAPCGSPTPGVTDYNALQIFDFNSKYDSLEKVGSVNFQGGIAGTAWIPASNGTVFVMSQSINAVLQPSGPTVINTGSSVLSWVVFDKCNNKFDVLGPLQLGQAIYLRISDDSKWLIAGVDITTPIGSLEIPGFAYPATSFGIQADCFGTGTVPQTGWNTLLLYKLKYDI